MTKIAILVGALLLPCVAAAHPEHASGDDFGFVHYLSDPFHVGLTVMAVVAFLVVRRSMLARHSLYRPRG